MNIGEYVTEEVISRLYVFLRELYVQSETLAYVVIGTQKVWGFLVFVEIGRDVGIGWPWLACKGENKS